MSAEGRCVVVGYDGRPSGVLLRIAAERAADLIVLGRHHRRLGAVLPSVLRDVLHATEVPVVVVP